MTSKQENELIIQNPREYRIWKGVVSRGIGRTNSRIYFERGISVCNRWLDFENFLKDMGKCGEYLSLDRVDVNGGYSPDNCRWADAYTQANNKQRTHYLTYLGKKTPISEVAFKIGVPSGVILGRLSRHGIGAKKAIQLPYESNYQKRCRNGGVPHIPVLCILDYWLEAEAGRIKKIEMGFRQLREFLTKGNEVTYPPPPNMKYKGVPILRTAFVDELRLWLKDGLFVTFDSKRTTLGNHNKSQSRNLLPNSARAAKIYDF